jgi:hypothetical protein
MAKNFYKAVGGITDGMSFHGAGEVFVGSEAIDSHFEDTSGKSGDDVLYEKVDRAAFDKYMAGVNHALVDGAPRGVVGFEPSGEDSIVSTQHVDGVNDSDLLKADPETGKPSDGDPLAFDSAEAERRGTASADGASGGAGPAKGEKVEAPAPTKRSGTPTA